eukprot:8035902-Prorocentrum_lima.AAC.1
MRGPQDPCWRAACAASRLGSMHGASAAQVTAAKMRRVVVGSCKGRKLEPRGGPSPLGIHTRRSVLSPRIVEICSCFPLLHA